MAVRARRRSTFRHIVADNEPPTPANAAAVWWADDIAQSDGSAVASWTDRISGFVLAQVVAGNQPVLNVDAIGGQPSVDFDGSNDVLRYAATNAVSTAAQGCVIAVVSADVLTGNIIWGSADEASTTRHMNGQVNASSRVALTQWNNEGVNDAVQGSTTLSTGVPMALEWSSTSSAWSLRVNNTAETVGVITATNTGDWFGDTSSRDSFSVGALVRSSTTNFFDGSLAYLGVFDSPLSAQDRYDLYKWIEEYYGITGMPGLSDYEQAVLLDNPSAFWPMQEMSGDITDITGSGHTGTKVGSGGVTYNVGGPVAGINAIEFAGSSGVGYSVADNNLWSSTNFTVEGWIYLASGFFGAQPGRYFLTKHSSGVTNEWFTMVENASGRRLIAQVCNTLDTAWANKVIGPTWGAENTWYHVAWKLSSSTVTLYVNGVAVGSADSSSGSRASNSSGVLSIGHGPAVAGRSWNGRMAMVAFYAQALSDAQILAHYQAMA